MIQRIQTIYLVLVIICLGLTFLFPFATYTLSSVEESNFIFNVFGLDIEGNNKIKFPYYVSIALSIGLSLFTISRFKNRVLQMKLGRFNYLTILLTIVLSFINIRTIEDLFPAGNVTVAFGVGLFMPVAALVFLFLANRSIKNDEKLIKSIDRIR